MTLAIPGGVSEDRCSDVTSWPAFRSAFAKCLPIKPVAPVSRTLRLVSILLPHDSLLSRTGPRIEPYILRRLRPIAPDLGLHQLERIPAGREVRIPLRGPLDCLSCVEPRPPRQRFRSEAA